MQEERGEEAVREDNCRGADVDIGCGVGERRIGVGGGGGVEFWGCPGFNMDEVADVEIAGGDGVEDDGEEEVVGVRVLLDCAPDCARHDGAFVWL